jgi:hypothetical protein
VTLEVRYFERRQIKDAIAFAEGGGIAIHRNFDHYHGSTIRGMRRERPEWIQPEKRRKVAHYDVFGPYAQELIAKWSPPDTA